MKISKGEDRYTVLSFNTVIILIINSLRRSDFNRDVSSKIHPVGHLGSPSLHHNRRLPDTLYLLLQRAGLCLDRVQVYVDPELFVRLEELYVLSGVLQLLKLPLQRVLQLRGHVSEAK